MTILIVVEDMNIEYLIVVVEKDLIKEVEVVQVVL